MANIKKFFSFARINIILLVVIWLTTVLVYAETTSKPNNHEYFSYDNYMKTSETSEEYELLNNNPILFNNIKYKTFYDIYSGEDYISNIDVLINRLSSAINTEEYTNSAAMLMEQEILRLSEIKLAVTSDIEHYRLWETEYYYATRTWMFLKQKGYSDVIASAIIGNIMVEVGGNTLDIDPYLYDAATGRYYGLCQWSLKHRPGVDGISFEEQLDYLISDIEKEFKAFGFCYKKGFTYNDFISMTDPAEAALAFAKVYERCASFSYKLRKPAAKQAFEYFNLGTLIY